VEIVAGNDPVGHPPPSTRVEQENLSVFPKFDVVGTELLGAAFVLGA
jgi:hypothetical protein